MVGFGEAVTNIVGMEGASVPLTHTSYTDQLALGMAALFLSVVIVVIGGHLLHLFCVGCLVLLFVCYAAIVLGFFISAGGWATGTITVDNEGDLETFNVTGISGSTLRANLRSHFTDDYGFTSLLGLIFPTFIGISQGVSRSDSLANPFSDIPRGAFAAILTSFSLYSLFFILLGAVAPSNTLIGVPLLLPFVAWPSRWIG